MKLLTRTSNTISKILKDFESQDMNAKTISAIVLKK